MLDFLVILTTAFAAPGIATSPKKGHLSVCFLQRGYTAPNRLFGRNRGKRRFLPVSNTPGLNVSVGLFSDKKRAKKQTKRANSVLLSSKRHALVCVRFKKSHKEHTNVGFDRRLLSLYYRSFTYTLYSLSI